MPTGEPVQFDRFPRFFFSWKGQVNSRASGVLGLIGCLGLLACDTVEADLPGQLVHMEVVAASDSCTPRRATGDAGTQFVGRLADGGLTFTWPAAMQWGPRVDGGVSALADSATVAPMGKLVVGLGSPATCLGTLVTSLVDGGVITLDQVYPQVGSCDVAFFAEDACAARRVLLIDPLRDCSSRCVRYAPGTGEATCGC
jgi:hypothetical protein